MSTHICPSWQDRLVRLARRAVLRRQAAMLCPGVRRAIRRCLRMGATAEELSRAAQRVGATPAVRVWAYLRLLGKI